MRLLILLFALARAEEPPSYPKLETIFSGVLEAEQSAALGDKPTLEQRVAAMTPDQRTLARTRLAKEESRAKSPAELKELAKGYLLLDENSEQAGRGAVRLAAQIKGAEPNGSDGYTLAASGLHQAGDYSGAAEQAREALRRNPNDKAAFAVLKLSEERVGQAKLDQQPAASAQIGQFGDSRSDEHLPVKLPVKVGPYKAVPALSSDAPPQGPSPLLPLGLGAGLSLTAYGLYRSKDTWNPGTEPPPEQPVDERPTNWGRTLLFAGLGAAAITAIVFPPSLPSIPALTPVFAGAGGAAGAAIGEAVALDAAVKAAVVTGGAYVAVQTAPDLYSFAKHDKNRDVTGDEFEPPIKRKTTAAPKDAPRGTKPIDRSGLTKDQIHDIKTAVDAKPNDWTGITPDGRVVTTTPSGNAKVRDHWRNYTHHK